MNISFDEGPLAKNAQGNSKNYHEVLLLMKFLQTKPQVINMNINCYDFNYSVIKIRDDKENVENKNEKDFNNFNDIVPNRYTGRKKE